MTTAFKLHVAAPLADESLLGYLYRLAELNAYPDLAQFLSTHGFRYGRRLVEEAAHLERILGLQPGLLEPILPSARPDRAAFDWRFERHHSAPVCPGCLAEGLPHRQSWRHALVSACTEHEVQLQDQCPRCRTTLHPGRGGRRKCACGTDLAILVQSDADQWEMAVARMIEGLVADPGLGLPTTLAGAAPSDIGRFLFFLGGSLLDQRTAKSGKASTPKTVSETRRFMRDVQSLLCAFPSGFDGHLTDRWAAGDPNGLTLPARLGGWYQSLMRFRDPAYLPFHQRLSVFSGRVYAAATNEVTAPKPDDDRWIPATEAARQIGIRAERLVAAVSVREVEGRMSQKGIGHRHCSVRESVIREIQLNRRDYLTGLEAREMLGLSKNQFRLLLAAGLLQSYAPSDRPALTDGPYLRSEIRTLVDRIIAHAQPSDDDMIAFREINLRRTTDRKAILAAYVAISSGEVRCVDPGETDRLGDLRFPAPDVLAITRSVSRHVTLTANEAAAAIGCKAQCVAHWCTEGLIAADIRTIADKTTFAITPDALAGFLSRYTPLSVLARQMSTSSQQLQKRLLDAGLELPGSFVDGAVRRGHLVRIADLVRVMTVRAVSNEGNP